MFSNHSFSPIRRPGCSLIAVDPSHYLGFLWPNPQRGKIGSVNAKYEPYVKAGNLLLPAVSIVTPRTMVFVADPEVIKTVMTDRSGTFQKDPQTYTVLHVYGINIIGPSHSPELCHVCNMKCRLRWTRLEKTTGCCARSFQRGKSLDIYNILSFISCQGNVALVWKETCKSSKQALDQLGSLWFRGPVDVTVLMKEVGSSLLNMLLDIRS